MHMWLAPDISAVARVTHCTPFTLYIQFKPQANVTHTTIIVSALSTGQTSYSLYATCSSNLTLKSHRHNHHHVSPVDGANFLSLIHYLQFKFDTEVTQTNNLHHSSRVARANTLSPVRFLQFEPDA